uniref:helix-turn-helix domain-containing protein n=1 Tax=Nonomuraea sp. CA-251285 TaxID=3240002 RepID=UPI003F491CD2
MLPVGALIRAYRQARQMTQAELATAAGSSLRYLEMIEQGVRVPSLEALQRYAAALNVPASALLDNSRAHADYGRVEAALLAPHGTIARQSCPRCVQADLDRARQDWEHATIFHEAALALLPRLLQEAARLGAMSDEQAHITAREIYALAVAVTEHARPDLSKEAARRSAKLGPGSAADGGTRKG